MGSSDSIKLEGTVLKSHRGGLFDVEVETGEGANITKQMVIARCSGKMKQYQIRIAMGDRVDVELSPYDLTKGRITRRHTSRK